MLIEIGLNCAGLTRLLTNGAGRVRAVPLLHAADATWVKSPLSISWVGTKAC